MPEASDLGPTLREIGMFRVTPNPMERYEEVFSVRFSDLPSGSTVLDIGSGCNQELARGIENIRKDVRVFSIDPSLALPAKKDALDKMGVKYELGDNNGGIHKAKEEEIVARRKSAHPRVLAAIAPRLPFASGFFDRVFDNHGAFMYFSKSKPQRFKEYIEEILRVLKEDGEAYIYPIDLYDETLLSEEERIEISQRRVETIRSLFGEECDCDSFEFNDGKRRDIRRLGIKLKKRGRK